VGDWRKAKSYKQGYEFNVDLMALQVARGTKLRHERSFLKVEPDNVIATALKKAQRENSLILRLYEAAGKETETVITLFKTPKKIEQVNLIEEEDRELEKSLAAKDNEVKLTVSPFEIVTLKIEL
jgi:alpha-mannosidase